MPNPLSLITNSGIQMLAYSVNLDIVKERKRKFHEWFDKDNAQWCIEPLETFTFDGCECLYHSKTLHDEGYLHPAQQTRITYDLLKKDNIEPLSINSEMQNGVSGICYSAEGRELNDTISKYENKWLPLPIFYKTKSGRFSLGPNNWARIKFVPQKSQQANVEKNKTGHEYAYDILVAFDTRSNNNSGEMEYGEYPVFKDQYTDTIRLGLCDNIYILMDYCSAGKKWEYINDYLFHIINPGVRNASMLRNEEHKLSYIAVYVVLMQALAHADVLHDIDLIHDSKVQQKQVDLIVDIGNSQTTAVLVEGSSFTEMRRLELMDYTLPLRYNNSGEAELNLHDGSFDMRLTFRRADFGDFGYKDSRQFNYPSLVRLGEEANYLLHQTSTITDPDVVLSTFSSPKRYLWDKTRVSEEWRFLTIDGESEDGTLNINGITDQILDDGKVIQARESLQSNTLAKNNGNAIGGTSFHYSHCSLMTFAFLEILQQANTQINSAKHRSIIQGVGDEKIPRKLRRIVVTCPTSMSSEERKSLSDCARDAAKLFTSYYTSTGFEQPQIIVTPQADTNTYDDDNQGWYYDEATCAQLVYMYGEIAEKYNGNSSEFFNLYSKENDKESLTIASIDIGAGTTDIMVSRYTYTHDTVTTLRPEPIFYDSFYYAGDDMMHSLIKQVFIHNKDGAFRRALPTRGDEEYRQIMKNLVGPDYNGQTAEDRMLRRDFCLQYLVPLMQHHLELLKGTVENIDIKFSDVFFKNPPNRWIIDGVKKRTGIDVEQLVWKFNKAEISELVRKEFEPWIKQIATIFHACGADIVLLSGRPTTLPPLRELFLRNYPVSPGRLISLSGYYVGDWYPFGQNTGHIVDPKTIVAIGGILGFYGTDFNNLKNFNLDMSALNTGLRSNVNYISAPPINQHNSDEQEYIITPEKKSGELTITQCPRTLQTRREDIDTYPWRDLYEISFNMQQIRKNILSKNPDLENNRSLLQNEIDSKISEYRRRMPFKASIERDDDNYEKLNILEIQNRDGESEDVNILDISIRSMGIDEVYWLDTGVFYF